MVSVSGRPGNDQSIVPLGGSVLCSVSRSDEDGSSKMYCDDLTCTGFDSLDKVLGEELLDDMRKYLVRFWTLYE